MGNKRASETEIDNKISLKKIKFNEIETPMKINAIKTTMNR